MKERHNTQWAAQFAVASELCKRKYQVALTLGNHPLIDLKVVSPNGKLFLVDVKGQRTKGFWQIRSKPLLEDLYYVLAFVPDEGANCFFILTQRQVNEQIIKEKEATQKRALDKGRSAEKAGLFPGVSWRFAQSYENAWESLPD